MILKAGHMKLSSQRSKGKRINVSEKKPLFLWNTMKRKILTLLEFQEKRKGHKVYLKQQWLKNPQIWGEKCTSRFLRPKEAQIV